jgi:hypothetical protein
MSWLRRAGEGAAMIVVEMAFQFIAILAMNVILRLDWRELGWLRLVAFSFVLALYRVL